MKRILGTAVLVLSLAACGSAGDTTADPGDLGLRGVESVTIQYKGKPLDCVKFGRNHGSLTCDFVKYHAQ